ncbi:hypothetical protein H0H93_011880, partial [Arthromyces matolae]
GKGKQRLVIGGGGDGAGPSGGGNSGDITADGVAEDEEEEGNGGASQAGMDEDEEEEGNGGASQAVRSGIPKAKLDERSRNLFVIEKSQGKEGAAAVLGGSAKRVFHANAEDIPVARANTFGKMNGNKVSRSKSNTNAVLQRSLQLLATSKNVSEWVEASKEKRRKIHGAAVPDTTLEAALYQMRSRTTLPTQTVTATLKEGPQYNPAAYPRGSSHAYMLRSQFATDVVGDLRIDDVNDAKADKYVNWVSSQLRQKVRASNDFNILARYGSSIIQALNILEEEAKCFGCASRLPGFPKISKKGSEDQQQKSQPRTHQQEADQLVYVQTQGHGFLEGDSVFIRAVPRVVRTYLTEESFGEDASKDPVVPFEYQLHCIKECPPTMLNRMLTVKDDAKQFQYNFFLHPSTTRTVFANVMERCLQANIELHLDSWDNDKLGNLFGFLFFTPLPYPNGYATQLDLPRLR